MSSAGFIDKFGVKTIIVHGVSFAASLFVTSVMASPTSNEFIPVDLNTRPFISSNIGEGARQDFKIMEFGEYANPTLAEKVYQDAAGKEKEIENLPRHFLRGNTNVMNKGTFSANFNVCLITHKQNEDLSNSGKFYLFENDTPSLFNKDYVDFFTKSHEAEHCFFLVRFPEKYKQPENFERTHIAGNSVERYNNYALSLKEVSADLGAVLDYMRQTGTNDLYTEFLRPFRISSIGLTNHKTAWALDVILKDIDPTSIQKKDPSEIPNLVEALMDKHFLGPDGTYFPDTLPLDASKLSHETPAARALYDEIRADMHLTHKLPGSESHLEDRLKKDVHDTISAHITSYAANQDPEAVGLAMKLYSNLANQYGLQKLSFSLKGKPPKEPQVVKSFIDPYLKLMLTP